MTKQAVCSFFNREYSIIVCEKDIRKKYEFIKKTREILG